MARYGQVKDLDDQKFKLLTGVKKETFNLMIKYLKEAQLKKKQSGQW